MTFLVIFGIWCAVSVPAALIVARVIHGNPQQEKSVPNKKIMKKWATVLEYGGYTQGKGKLRDTKTDERCCLGVLCDIAVADGVIPAPVAIGSNYRYGDEPIGDGSTTGLPPAVRKWAGLEVGYGNPRVDWNGQNTTLIDLNDNGKATFKDIAGVIRDQLVND